MTYRSSKSVHFCALGASRKIKQKIFKQLKKKGIPKKPQQVFFHVFAQSTHVVAAPHGFACVGIPATRLYIPSFVEIRSGVSEPQGVKIWPFPLLWLVAFTTACTTVQAVTSHDRITWQVKCLYFHVYVSQIFLGANFAPSLLIFSISKPFFGRC